MVTQPYQQHYQQHRGGRDGGSQGGHARCARGGGGWGQLAPTQYIGGNQMIPYIPAGVQKSPTTPPAIPNFVKTWANQNVCFTSGFVVEDWHTSITCPKKKQGHQDGFMHSNYMEYKWANHRFCCKGMHKTMYPSMWQCWAMNYVNVSLVKCVSSYYLLHPTQNIMVAASRRWLPLQTPPPPGNVFPNKCMQWW